MAFDEELAGRLRALLGGTPGLSERRMFGGLAFLVAGNMAVAASGEGGFLVRVDPSRSAELVGSSSAEVAVMQGRAMPGWLRVTAQAVADDDELARWAGIGSAYAASLPPK